MISEAICCLGKYGDVLSILPLLQFKANGSKVNLVIAKQYADVVAGCDYINPIIWDGHWQDLAGAIRMAKSRFDKVVVPQTYGKHMAIEQKTPSFQYDQWLRAGGLAKWDKLPCTISRTENVGIVEQFTQGKPTILVADKGESSPFEHADQLVSKLAEAFPNHLVLRLSTVRADAMIDLLHLYDAAKAIVVTETAHLHLAKATATPVFALVTDKPYRWHGSAWSQKHLLHIRYSQYERREQELIESVWRVVAGDTLPRPSIVKTVQDNGYNASIGEWNGRRLMSYRWHPNHKEWRTNIAIRENKESCFEEKPLKLSGIYAEMSHEDARFFTFRGKPCLSLTVAAYPVPQNVVPPCAIVWGELVEHLNHWTLEKVYQPKYGSNDFSSQQKNWVFFEQNQRLHFIYECSPEQTVCRLADDGVVVDQFYKSKSPSWIHGEIRGGTQPLLHKGKWLRFFHSLHKQGKDRREWTYCVGAMLMNPEPPFQIEAISKWPIHSGDERWVAGWTYWKPAVSICYGAIPDGDGWLISGGLNDSFCFTMNLKEKDLNLP